MLRDTGYCRKSAHHVIVYIVYVQAKKRGGAAGDQNDSSYFACFIANDVFVVLKLLSRSGGTICVVQK